ncbi:MAG: hypothetical protein EXS63_07380 [Candidatus Omnitrophica bacterium]|nr:hypothetical protein [Candidatus Omnitrophota bacterium]
MKIFIFYAEAGHGHKKAAETIGKALIEHGNPPQDILIQDALDYAPGFNKKGYIAFYFYCVKFLPKLWGWFYDRADKGILYELTKPIRVIFNNINGERLIRKIVQEKPDLVISTHFFASEIVARAKRDGRTDTKLMTVITDFLPHTLWINDGTDAYWVMHEETKQEMIRRKVEAHRIVPGGIPVDPIFKPQKKRVEILQKYGFFEDRLTILISSGSFGIGSYEETLRQLETFKDKIQCFVVCGNNEEGRKILEQKTFLFPVKVFGFVNFMAELMEASDLMIAKSGGLTTAESLAKGLPMIITQPIPGQETRNAEFLKKHEASFFIQVPEQAKILLKNILEHPHILASKKEAIKRLAKPNSAQEIADFAFQLGVPHSHESSHR